MPDLWIVLSIALLAWFAGVPLCLVWGSLRMGRTGEGASSESDEPGTGHVMRGLTTRAAAASGSRQHPR